jgi:hypothetical protein
MKIAAIAVLSVAAATLCSAQTTPPALASGASIAPYIEGSVWEISMIRTKPGMDDDYLKNLAGAWKATNEEAKKQGIIQDYKVLIGEASGREDYNMLLMVQFKNMAALDGLREKTDPIARKLIGDENAMRQGSMKRMEVRDILGAKTMREITLK